MLRYPSMSDFLNSFGVDEVDRSADKSQRSGELKFGRESGEPTEVRKIILCLQISCWKPS
jgi:hypothetical protein